MDFGTVLQFLPSVVKAGAAISQNNRAKRLASQPRPQYQVPEAVEDAVDVARSEYLNPNLYARNYAVENVNQGAAQGIRAAKDSGGGANGVLATIAALNANQNNAYQNIAAQGQLKRSQDAWRLERQLGNLGSYQDREFMVNEMQPYLDYQQAAQDLFYASRGNTDSLLSDLTRAGSAYSTYKGMRDAYGPVNPSNTPTSTQTPQTQQKGNPLMDNVSKVLNVLGMTNYNMSKQAMSNIDGFLANGGR